MNIVKKNEIPLGYISNKKEIFKLNPETFSNSAKYSIKYQNIYKRNQV